MIGAFLATATRSHDVAFFRLLEKGSPPFFTEFRPAHPALCDLIARDRVSFDIGPIRHGIACGGTIPFFGPADNRNEDFCSGYVFHPDRPVPIWTESGCAVFWYGPGISENFLSVTT